MKRLEVSDNPRLSGEPETPSGEKVIAIRRCVVLVTISSDIQKLYISTKTTNLDVLAVVCDL